MNTSTWLKLVLIVSLSLSYFPLKAAAHNNNVVTTSITCGPETPVYDASGFVVGWNVYISATNDHPGHPTEINGPFGSGEGTHYVDSPFLPSYVYTIQVSEYEGHAGSISQCQGGGQGPPESPPPPPSGPPPPPAPQCPNTSTTIVFLSPASIEIGETSTAVAPTGWSGGTFTTSSPSVASIGNSLSSTSATITGISQGTSNIAGVGWRASNGASNCTLGPNILTVNQNLNGNITADPNPIEICSPETLGITTISVLANTYTKVEVYGAQGITDGTVLFSALANTPTSQATGKWVKNGTVFKLVAPYSGNREIDTVTVGLVIKNCVAPPPSGPPPGPPPPGGPPPPSNKAPWAAVYNTNTVPSEYGLVTCGKLLAVWKNIADPGAIDGYRVYNETLHKYIELKNPTQSRHEFDPVEVGSTNPDAAYNYGVASFTGASEGNHAQAGSIAPVTNCNNGGGPDLTPSNKDIVRVRSVNLAYETTNLRADANFTPESLPVRDRDKITFAINIVNGGQTSVTGNITVIDTMYNMHIPSKKVNASIRCNNECILTTQDYDDANRRITFVISPTSGSLDTGEAWTIFYTAETIAPQNITGSIYRFQNRASLGFPSTILQTPYVPVIKDTGAPNIYEIR